jgi:NHLM bacteriocin system secretion protein
MVERPRAIFRTKALERVSSPDNLDQVIDIISPKDWLPLTVLGALLALAVAWGVAGRVPTTVTGRGILIHPGQVFAVQTLAAGRLDAVPVKAGDRVLSGQVIARVDQFDLKRRLAEDAILAQALERQDRASTSAQNARAALQTQETSQQSAALEAQAESLRQNLADAKALAPVLQQRLAGLQKLRDQGLLAGLAPELVAARQAQVENTQNIASLTTLLTQIDVQLTAARALEADVAQANLDSAAARLNALQEVRSRMAVTKLQLERDSDIVARQAGRVAEVSVVAGQVVAAGDHIATIEVDGAADVLTSVSYFAVGDGKRIEPGMVVQVIPDNVERQRFGGITGTVLSVGPLPATLEGSKALVGSMEAAQALLPGEPRLEVIAKLDPDPSTPSRYHWSSSHGPALTMTAGLTTSVRVTVESRSPVSYVLPFLRELAGVY